MSEPKALHSYHPDQVMSVKDIERHDQDCPAGKYSQWFRPPKCACTPTKGKRIVIEVWFDDAENVKG